MRYKVTSKADIIILANVPTKDDGEGKITKPSETLRWVPIFANKPRDGLGTILGVDPRCVRESAIIEGHFTYVPIGAANDCCKEHFGLFKIEPSSVPD